MHEVSKQQEYYKRTASLYEEMYDDEPEHEFAIAFLSSLLLYFSASSLLDVRSGTGRVIRRLKNDPRHENLTIKRIEPVADLREQAYKIGIKKMKSLMEMRQKIQFEERSFDFACAFSVLHHVKSSEYIIKEMIRVANRGIFISDMNNFGCGILSERTIKQFIKVLGLWKAFQFVRTLGKGYKYSEGDGIHYSYSVYDNYRQLSNLCSDIFILNTGGKGKNPYRSCSHVALVGITDPGIAILASQAGKPTLSRGSATKTLVFYVRISKK